MENNKNRKQVENDLKDHFCQRSRVYPVAVQSCALMKVIEEKI